MAATKKKQGGSVQDAQAQAATPPTVQSQSTQRWEPGKYILLADRYQPVQDGLDFVKGDLIELKESDAQRLGRAGAIAPEGSREARRAQARTDQEQAQVRAEELRAEADRLQQSYESDHQQDEE